MNFTYEAYAQLIEKLNAHGYRLTSYGETSAKEMENVAVIRHDVDYSLEKALEMAKCEEEIGISTTYLLLLSGDFYNVFSRQARTIIQGIQNSGHHIGLHFDETIYKISDRSGGGVEFLIEKIVKEAELLSGVTELPVTVVSMHRPSKWLLDMDIQIPGIVNTYSERFFKDYKYVSDSRRIWREPIEEIVDEHRFSKLQILVHPFWYNHSNMNLHDSVSRFVNMANSERYGYLNENISRLSEIMEKGEIKR